MSFARAARTDELWIGEMRGAVVEGARVLLVNVEGVVFAYEDRCAHQAAPLSEGRFDGRTITCARHEWSYDACTGCGINPKSAQLRALPVRVEGGDVLVEVSAREEGADPGTAPVAVGPVLHASGRASAVVAAIREENADAEVLDRGAYLRVLAPSPCRVTRAAIERHAGVPFALPGDLEALMPSFKGRLEITDSAVVWWSGRRDEP
jgi:toluene monooxygenase system ferredoxin subunit